MPHVRLINNRLKKSVSEKTEKSDEKGKIHEKLVNKKAKKVKKKKPNSLAEITSNQLNCSKSSLPIFIPLVNNNSNLNENVKNDESDSSESEYLVNNNKKKDKESRYFWLDEDDSSESDQPDEDMIEKEKALRPPIRILPRFLLD